MCYYTGKRSESMAIADFLQLYLAGDITGEEERNSSDVLHEVVLK